MEPTKFGIHIKTKDFDKSLHFYLNFGFKPVFVYGPSSFTINFDTPNAAEKYRGITFDINGAMLELGEDHIAIKRQVFEETISSSKVSAMIDVNTLSSVRKICEEHNFEIAKSEVEYPWGTRELVVRDPDGFILVFRESING